MKTLIYKMNFRNWLKILPPMDSGMLERIQICCYDAAPL
ncbi:hypothetical protein N008_15580 [Hymenobacter sp. APR13]|nr:hypothetical protein N008_15580 [Hymenobacter sp. APR13]